MVHKPNISIKQKFKELYPVAYILTELRKLNSSKENDPEKKTISLIKKLKTSFQDKFTEKKLNLICNVCFQENLFKIISFLQNDFSINITKKEYAKMALRKRNSDMWIFLLKGISEYSDDDKLDVFMEANITNNPDFTTFFFKNYEFNNVEYLSELLCHTKFMKEIYTDLNQQYDEEFSIEWDILIDFINNEIDFITNN